MTFGSASHPPKPPHDGRGAARPKGTRASSGHSGGSNAIDSATGAKGGFEAFAAHELANQKSHGHMTGGDHRWVVDTIDPQTQARQMEQLRSRYAGLPDDQRQQWETRANMDDVRSPREMGDSSPSAGGANAPGASSARLSTGELDTTDLNGNTTPFPGSYAPAAFRASSRPGPYGKLGQSQERLAADATTTDAQGNRSIATASGGSVTIPASQSQEAPDQTFAPSNGERVGIYRDGTEQVKQPDGSFAPGTTSLPLATGAAPSNPLLNATDPTAPTPSADALTSSLMQPPTQTADAGATSNTQASGVPFPGTYPDDEEDEEGTARAVPGFPGKYRKSFANAA